MSCSSFYKGSLAGLLLFGAEILAAQTTSTNVRGTAMTTGIVGLTSTQTARLNVLNLQPVIPGVAAVLCPATLEFYDDKGALVKQLVVTNISPAASTRAQIRAVVFTPSTCAVTTGSDSLPTPMIAMSIGCSVMASLEIIDDLTGDTHTFTTDLRAMSPYRTLLLPSAGR